MESPDASLDAAVDSAGISDAGKAGDAAREPGNSAKIVFATSTKYRGGDLGGLSGADDKCALHADDAGLDGTFQAWLSKTTASVATRLDHADVPYVRTDGTQVARDWRDLVDGELDAAIELDAHGDAQSGDAWTGTLAEGTSYDGGDCQEWTSSSNEHRSQCGSLGRTDAAWTARVIPSCDTSLHLYCIEQ